MNYNYLTNNFPYNIRNILNNRNIDNQPNTTIPPNINRTTFNSTSNNETSSSRSLYDRTLYNTMNDRYVRITSDGIQYVPGSIWIEYRIRRDIEEERIRDQTRITLLNEIEGILNRLERRRNREGMRERVRNYRNINTNTSENENNVSTTTNQDSRSEQNSENRANQNLYDTTLNSTDNSNINTSVNSTLDTTINDILIRNPNIFSIGVSSYSTRNQDLEQGETNEQRNMYSRQFTRNSNIALNNTFMEIINTAIEDTFNINEAINNRHILSSQELEQRTTLLIKTTDDGLESCSICRENYQEGDEIRKINSCGHCFHKSCIDTWVNTTSTCPLCRTNI